MAFDNTNQADLTALNNEVSIDPSTMGYANAPIENTKELMKYLNDPSNNVNGDVAGSATFSHEVLMETWTPKGALNESTAWNEALTREGSPEPYKDKYLANCGPDSLAAYNALVQPLSRAEVLWGQNTVLTEEDWFLARDNG